MTLRVKNRPDLQRCIWQRARGGCDRCHFFGSRCREPGSFNARVSDLGVEVGL